MHLDLARARYSDLLRDARLEQLSSLAERPSPAERIRRAAASALVRLRRTRAAESPVPSPAV